MKITELLVEGEKSTKPYLESAFEMAGGQVEVESRSGRRDELESPSQIAGQLEGADLLLVSPHLRLSSRELFEKMPSEVYQSNEFDAVKIENGRIWPVHYHPLMLKNLLRTEISRLNRNASALIAGKDLFPSAAALILCQLGFKKITLVDHDDDLAHQYLQAWQKSFFGIDWSFESTLDLTQDSGQFSIVINCVSEEDEVLKTLYYFNFLRLNGLVLDMRPVGEDCSLIHEAREIKARAFSGQRLLGHRINMILKDFSLPLVDVDELMKKWATLET